MSDEPTWEQFAGRLPNDAKEDLYAALRQISGDEQVPDIQFWIWQELTEAPGAVLGTEDVSRWVRARILGLARAAGGWFPHQRIDLHIDDEFVSLQAWQSIYAAWKSAAK